MSEVGRASRLPPAVRAGVDRERAALALSHCSHPCLPRRFSLSLAERSAERNARFEGCREGEERVLAAEVGVAPSNRSAKSRMLA